MTADPNSLEHQLIVAYNGLFKAQEHALEGHGMMPVQPAIPFVGTHYGRNNLGKVLVYGSSENLNFKFDKEAMEPTRNRTEYSRWRTGEHKGQVQSKGNWFPWVHMTPVSDGTLLTAARYLIQLFEKPGFFLTPAEFIEQIAVCNYGKFSLNGNRNRDYASSPKPLAVSDDYVKVDLRILRPDIIIVPRSIHRHALHRILSDHDTITVPHAQPTIWGIYQTNRRVINTHITRQLKKAAWPADKERTGWENEWLAKVLDGTPMGRYLDWLDMQHQGGRILLE